MEADLTRCIVLLLPFRLKHPALQAYPFSCADISAWLALQRAGSGRWIIRRTAPE